MRKSCNGAGLQPFVWIVPGITKVDQPLPHAQPAPSDVSRQRDKPATQKNRNCSTARQYSRRPRYRRPVGCGPCSTPPLPVAKCATQDLWIPAHTEIVLEGVLRPDVTVREGPFAEFIGYLSPDNPDLEAFQTGLSRLGWVEGRNFVIEKRFGATTQEGLRTLAADLVAINLDVIVTITTPAALGAKRATSTIPIVMSGSSDGRSNRPSARTAIRIVCASLLCAPDRISARSTAVGARRSSAWRIARRAASALCASDCVVTNKPPRPQRAQRIYFFAVSATFAVLGGIVMSADAASKPSTRASARPGRADTRSSRRRSRPNRPSRPRASA